MADTPTKTEDGRWRVGEQIFDTNEAAWRYLDRREGQLISRSEDVADWVWSKEVHRRG